MPQNTYAKMSLERIPMNTWLTLSCKNSSFPNFVYQFTRPWALSESPCCTNILAVPEGVRLCVPQYCRPDEVDWYLDKVSSSGMMLKYFNIFMGCPCFFSFPSKVHFSRVRVFSFSCWFVEAHYILWIYSLAWWSIRQIWPQCVVYLFYFLYGIKMVFAEVERNLGIHMVSETFSARSLCNPLYHLGSFLTIV